MPKPTPAAESASPHASTMTSQTLHFMPQRSLSRTSLLARLGQAMQKHRKWILGTQWLVVVFYLGLLITPALMPIPAADQHIYNNLRLFAQFLFWGIWWPFVMLSMMVVGRVWCGVFCPEGALTEWISWRGLGLPIPRWIRWSGWPFTAFVCTTVYGQMISVYEYPQAALLVLGGSTVAALIIGFLYGRGKRVWCKYLCPANGVFALLAKIAPIHFAVDQQAWKAYTGQRQGQRQHAVDCAPLIDIAHMKSASSCHSCGRCADHRDGAVQLQARSPSKEILSLQNKDVSSEQAYTLLFGMLGIATAAFLWSGSAWLVEIKTQLAGWLIDRDMMLLLQDNAPWWLLTHQPAANDVFTWLDGLCLLSYVLGGGILLGAAHWLGVRLAHAVIGDQQLSWQRLALALIPIAGAGIFLGLSMLTISHLKAEGWTPHWLGQVRMLILFGAAGFSAWLAARLSMPLFSPRRLLGFLLFLLPLGLSVAVWYQTFFGN